MWPESNNLPILLSSFQRMFRWDVANSKGLHGFWDSWEFIRHLKGFLEDYFAWKKYSLYLVSTWCTMQDAGSKSRNKFYLALTRLQLESSVYTHLQRQCVNTTCSLLLLGLNTQWDSKEWTNGKKLWRFHKQTSVQMKISDTFCEILSKQSQIWNDQHRCC